jgi:ferric-dicitrate binding protein FerR (iron transport regulator)
MISLTGLRVVLVLSVLILVSMAVAANVPLQTTRSSEGKLLQFEGQVLINGAPATKGATIVSHTTISTSSQSSAVVSLAKLGRVEVLPESTIELDFSDGTISVSMLEQGRVRVSSSSNVSASVSTRDGKAITTSKQRNEFIVDTICGNTFVSVKKGSVELRAGSTVKQIAAGNQDTAGQTRPGCRPAP